jgi:hypothetical protein
MVSEPAANTPVVGAINEAAERAAPVLRNSLRETVFGVCMVRC